MATSLQNVLATPACQIFSRIPKPSQDHRAFASAINAAFGEGPTGQALAPGCADETSTSTIILDEPITATTVVDVLARAIKGEKAAETSAPTGLLGLGQKDEEELERDIVAEGSDSTEKEENALPLVAVDPPNDIIAVTYADPQQARALHFGLLSLMSAGGPGLVKSGEVEDSNSGAEKSATVDAAASKRTVPMSGELVFQLALQTTPNRSSSSTASPALSSADAKSVSAQRAGEAEPSTVEPPSRAPLRDGGFDMAALNLQSGQKDRAGEAARREEALPIPELSKNDSTRDGHVLMQFPDSQSSAKPASTTIEHPTARPAMTHFAEPVVPMPPELPASAVLQRIGMIVRGTDQLVRLDIRQNMGSVKVAVHSDDSALASQLRETLPELINRLEDRGLQARVTSFGSASPQTTRSESGGSSGQDQSAWSRDTDRHQQRRERNPRRVWREATWKLEED